MFDLFRVDQNSSNPEKWKVAYEGATLLRLYQYFKDNGALQPSSWTTPPPGWTAVHSLRPLNDPTFSASLVNFSPTFPTADDTLIFLGGFNGDFEAVRRAAMTVIPEITIGYPDPDVFTGFFQPWYSNANTLATTIAGLLPPVTGKTRQVMLLGYSWGGAVAATLAPLLQNFNAYWRYNTNVRCITYASPKTYISYGGSGPHPIGNLQTRTIDIKDFPPYDLRRMWHIINEFDVIPYLPHGGFLIPGNNSMLFRTHSIGNFSTIRTGPALYLSATDRPRGTPAHPYLTERAILRALQFYVVNNGTEEAAIIRDSHLLRRHCHRLRKVCYDARRENILTTTVLQNPEYLYCDAQNDILNSAQGETWGIPNFPLPVPVSPTPPDQDPPLAIAPSGNPALPARINESNNTPPRVPARTDRNIPAEEIFVAPPSYMPRGTPTNLRIKLASASIQNPPEILDHVTEAAYVGYAELAGAVWTRPVPDTLPGGTRTGVFSFAQSNPTSPPVPIVGVYLVGNFAGLDVMIAWVSITTNVPTSRETLVLEVTLNSFLDETAFTTITMHVLDRVVERGEPTRIHRRPNQQYRRIQRNLERLRQLEISRDLEVIDPFDTDLVNAYSVLIEWLNEAARLPSRTM